jgi:ABC-type branched-subunit amino acid transport system permease subunit
MATDPGFTPNYAQYQSKALTVDQLDKIASFVFIGGAGTTWGAMIAGIKLLVAVGYVWVRQAMVDKEIALQKQQYEVAQTNRNNNDVNQPIPVIVPPDLS